MQSSHTETQILLKKILGCSAAELYEILFSAQMGFMNFSIAMGNHYYDKQSEKLEQLAGKLKPYVFSARYEIRN